ncbi:MAG: DUF2249 domain-containing protein [Gemmatimonadaceae bacterium]
MNSATPVSPHDKVSDVLARDESLVEVFVRAAPHFGKLRNRAMRRVMARLVTVEQAARTANIPTERLVRDLNTALGFVDDRASVDVPASSPNAAQPDERHPEGAPVIEVDVRDDLRSGREPFSRIMSAVAALRYGEVLHLRAIFEPVPLFTVLGKRGFAHESEAHAVDDWSVWFWRPSTPIGTAFNAPVVSDSDDIPRDDERTLFLDVRGFNPPEPMMRTLAALDTLSEGRVLVQINNRVPQFLLPMLAERGFTWEIDESRPNRVLVRISHAA